MKTTRKITYAAVCAALAAVCIIAARFLPVKFVPLMFASVCFFVALKCGFFWGLLSMAAAILLTFFWGGNIDLAILLTGFLFAPYSIIAYFMQKLSYRKPLQAVIRGLIVSALWGAALAAIVFGFLDASGVFLFGIELGSVFVKSSMPWIYIIIAVVGSVLAVGFDVMFIMAWEVIHKRLKIKK